MFWKFNNAPSSQIDTILKENVSLQEVMDEEDIINECKAQNKALIEFLSKPEIMEELVTLTCIEPPPDLDERTRFKYPNIACELLTCDVPALNERLAGDGALLAKLYSFLDSEPPLNPLLASFFSKIMGVLIAKKTEQVLDFLKAKDNFISLLLKHLGTSAIMDLTLKLMTQVEELEMRQNILNWLDSQNIIQSLISLLDPAIDKERHYNVAQLLCDFIKTARDAQRNAQERTDPDPLLNALESPDTVSLLLDHILGAEKSESAIVGGIQVLLTLLDVNKSNIPKYDSQNIYNSSSYDETNDLEHRQKVTQSTVKTIQKRLKDFHNVLIDPPRKRQIETTFGVLEQPLGNTRLQVTRLLAAVISTNNAEALQELISLDTLQVLLDLFFKYQWNNFLHTQVELCVSAALKETQDNGDCSELCQHILIKCKLIERLLDAWKDNDQKQCETSGVRHGYMGHLINIANLIAHLCSTNSLGQFLAENIPAVYEEFEKFKDTTLQEINRTQETLLGGVHPNTSNEDSDEYGDVPFPQSALLQQQSFAHYQIQQLNPQMIETYGFNDDDFNDTDDTIQTIDHRTNMNFDLGEGDVGQQELFDKMCAENINTLDDTDDQIFEERDHTFETVIEKQTERHGGVCSSDSDEEDSPLTADEPIMDVDPWSSPNKAADLINPVTCSDPWGQGDKGSEQHMETGWADFSAASFSNFNAAFNAMENKQKHSETREKNARGESENKTASTAQETVVPAVEGAKKDDEAASIADEAPSATGNSSEKDSVLGVTEKSTTDSAAFLQTGSSAGQPDQNKQNV